MENPKEFYLNKIEGLKSEIQKLKGKRNVLTVAKLLVFIAIVVSIFYLLENQNTPQILALIGSLLAFIGLGVIDTKVNYNYHLKKQLEISVQTEVDYLNRDIKGLDSGIEFKDPKHFYSHDLDVFGRDSLFQFVNRTITKEGKSKLAQWLLGAKNSPQEIIAKQKVVEELKNLPDWRLLFNATGNIKEDDKKESSFKEWLENTALFNKKWKPFLYALIAGNAAIILSALIGNLNSNYPFYSSGVLLFIVFRFVKKTNKVHQNLDSFTKSFNHYNKLLQLVNQQAVKSELLTSHKAKLFGGNHNALFAFQGASKILGAFDQRSNILVTIVLNALYMRDLFLLIRLDQWKEKYNPYLLEWIDTLAEIDVLSSLANYHFNHPEFIVPNPVSEKIISARGLGHPSIPKELRICNNFELAENHRMDIITGANMAGKSTFLRTVGINLILAKCGGPVCAISFEFKPVTLFTSMRTTDDLADETSYFHAELLRLKQLIELAKSDEQIFIILDEILKGTNSKDKLNGSKRFLIGLLNLPVSGLVATHDLELGKLENAYPENFKNICFEIEINGNDINYDYKLKPGVSQNMNATLLMESMGLI